MMLNVLYVRDNTIMIPKRVRRGTAGWYDLAESSLLTEFGLVFHGGPQMGNILHWLRTGKRLVTSADDSMQGAIVRPDGTITEYNMSNTETFTNMFHMGKGFVYFRGPYYEEVEKIAALHACLPTVRKVKEAAEEQALMLKDSHRIFTLAQLKKYYEKHPLADLRDEVVPEKKAKN